MRRAWFQPFQSILNDLVVFEQHFKHPVCRCPITFRADRALRGSTLRAKLRHCEKVQILLYLLPRNGEGQHRILHDYLCILPHQLVVTHNNAYGIAVGYRWESALCLKLSVLHKNSCAGFVCLN